MSMIQPAAPAAPSPPTPGPKQTDGRTAQRPLALGMSARPEVGVFLGAIAVYVFSLAAASPVRGATSPEGILS